MHLVFSAHVIRKNLEVSNFLYVDAKKTNGWALIQALPFRGSEFVITSLDEMHAPAEKVKLVFL